MLHNVGEDGDVAGVLGQGIRQDEVKGGGVDQRLVAHQLQVKVGILDGADLPDAAGRGIVVGAGHQIAHAVGLAGIGDALVIGSDEDVVQLGAGFGGLVDPPDHGFAQHIRQRLAGHTGACITGRDHSDCFHKDTSLCRRVLRKASLWEGGGCAIAQTEGEGFGFRRAHRGKVSPPPASREQRGAFLRGGLH